MLEKLLKFLSGLFRPKQKSCYLTSHVATVNVVDLLDKVMINREPDIRAAIFPKTLFKSKPVYSSRKLKDADEDLQKAFRLIRLYYRSIRPGHTLVITRTFRSFEDQQKLYQKGRTTKGKKVTNIDGIKKLGKHNYYPSKAIDVAVRNESIKGITWNLYYYRPLVGLAKKVSKEIGVKITSGGSWKKLKDYPHLEIGK